MIEERCIESRVFWTSLCGRKTCEWMFPSYREAQKAEFAAYTDALPCKKCIKAGLKPNLLKK